MLNEENRMLPTDEGALELIMAVIKLAREDYVLDIQWLADHTDNPARVLTKRYSELNIRARKLGDALGKEKKRIKRNKRILESAESNEADLVRAREAIRESENLIAKLKPQHAEQRKEYRFLLKATTAVNEIGQIEEWVRESPEAIETWRKFALLEYLEDLKLSREQKRELTDRLRKDKRDPWILFREIREELTGSTERKGKRRRRK